MSPTEGSKQDEKSEVMPNENGLKAMKEFINGNGELEFSDNLNKHTLDSSILEALLGFDKGPPALSPKTMSDTDLDCASTVSPSVTVERRRRKPNSKDILRMTEVETDYYSEDSDDYKEEELLRQQMNSEEGVDEVDGEFTMAQMPLLNHQANLDTHTKSNNNPGSNGDLSPAQKDADLNKNNNIIHKTKPDVDDKEDIYGDIADTENKGIPFPPSSKPDQPGIDGENNGSQSKNTTPQELTGSNWLRGALNTFPMSPFQASQPELPFANSMSPFENKYSEAEQKKDNLKYQYCERTFQRNETLKNHIKSMHHGNSPQRKRPYEANDMNFKCTHYSYTTKHQSNLNGHLRTHTGERLYSCEACGVQYSQLNHLKSHIINKHNDIMPCYNKEKRNSSPQGIGHPTDSPVFKMPGSPMFPGNMRPGLPGGPPNSLYLQHSPQQQPPHLAGFKHSPQHHQIHGGGMPHNNMGSVPNSPIISPRGPQGQQQTYPGQQQMYPQQQMPHRPPFPPMPHIIADGHSLFFRHYNGMELQMRQQAEQIIPNGVGSQPQQQAGAQHQFHKSPLQENKIQDENGAIDLIKKAKEYGALDLAICDKKNNCTEDNPNCKSCPHLFKLTKLRTSVLSMLGILVPNLNFEDEGIDAEGDSVDDLLQNVIKSNNHDIKSND